MASANGGVGRGAAPLSSVNFYSHVPKDLSEATVIGAIMSIVCIITVTVLFVSETIAFSRTTVSTTLNVDEMPDKQIRLNFNVTMLDLKCNYASVDVWDALGSNRQNVTKNVEKWSTDREGKKIMFAGRAGKEREMKHEEHDETLEEMIKDGAYAKPIKEDKFDEFLFATERQMIDFFAPWCKFCKRLAPTWEKLAQEVFNEGMPIGIGTVDCTTERSLCSKYSISGFPTILYFEKGEKVGPAYNGDRTVDALRNFATAKINRDGKKWEEDKERTKKYKKFDLHTVEEHGCMLSGYLLVNRVPGNFHIEAKSKDHTIDPAMTNLTHIVHELSFGDPGFVRDRKMKKLLDYNLPKDVRQLSPFDGNTFTTTEYHQATHHYMKVVPTAVNVGGSKLTSYQVLGQSQLVYYDIVNVPEARFSYDLSPMSVTVRKRSRKWYEYITSLCAIIGGAYTTLGLIDAVLFKVFKGKKID